jgi:ParB family transcriptional regulator, chromosome partitioning protein
MQNQFFKRHSSMLKSKIIMENSPSQFYKDSIFWVEVDKINPNPFQPRKEFGEAPLQSLADSIRQYGVLQALVVTRKEIERDDGGLTVEYELIAGERRLKAAKLAGVREVPVLIRNSEDDDLLKLELSIIENIQREDLNPVDRARAFSRLVNEFKFKHSQVAEKVGKSREYVTNSLRILSLPEYVLTALSHGKITEGHTRPIMMLSEKPAEQEVLFKEIITRKLTVREAEYISRKIAFNNGRAKKSADPQIQALEDKLSNTLGAKVHIEKGAKGGKISIDFFSDEDLNSILTAIEKNPAEEKIDKSASSDLETELLDDRSKEEKEEEELYFIKNFSI